MNKLQDIKAAVERCYGAADLNNFEVEDFDLDVALEPQCFTTVASHAYAEDVY